ncbi:MAG: prephenate dehydrogenase [Methanobacteriaceae archaeon]|nr:prephenate dehydrogenase [Methanobacteriaceae archaeon]
MTKRNITIIGATRGLGKWIAKYLNNFEHNITITSRNSKEGKIVANKLKVNYSNNNIKAIQNADIIIFAVPLDKMEETIKEIAPYAPPNSVLIDIASIKINSANALKKYAPENTEILPTHPMFGPRLPSLEGQIVILTPTDINGSWFKIIKKFLIQENTHIIISSPEEHDKMMSIVQGLTHFTYITLASTIKKLNISMKESRNFASPIYNMMLDMISRIVAQNPYMYYAIQKQNPETRKSRNCLINEINYMNNLIEKGDEKTFVSIMSNSAKHFDDFEESLGRSDKAINALNTELVYLKNNIGMEVGLKHRYNGNIHVGIISEVNNEVVIINKSNKQLKIKISNIDILSKEELLDWKKNNLNRYYYDLSVIFSKSCDEGILADIFRKIDQVIDVDIIDEYYGNQISYDQMSITFHYSVFDKEDRFVVEDYIQGMGGIIR